MSFQRGVMLVRARVEVASINVGQAVDRGMPTAYRNLAAPLLPLCDDDSGQAVVCPVHQFGFRPKVAACSVEDALIQA